MLATRETAHHSRGGWAGDSTCCVQHTRVRPKSCGGPSDVLNGDIWRGAGPPPHPPQLGPWPCLLARPHQSPGSRFQTE